MEHTCPICFKKFNKLVLEHHVNTCLDSQEVVPPKQSETIQVKETSQEKPLSQTRNQPNIFNALGLHTQPLKPKLTEENGNSQPNEESKRPRVASGDARVKTSDTDNQSKTNISSKRSIEETNDNRANKISRTTSWPTAGKSRSMENDRSNADLARMKKEARMPLAERLRPTTLSEYYGQEKLVGPSGILRNFIESDQLPSFVLWGVPGTGKTSLARIIINSTKNRSIEISGANRNSKNLKDAFVTAENESKLTGRKTILFIDEIHRLNKAVQDLLLPVLEKGTVTIIGATTENPSFTLNNALLSRMHTFVMDKLSQESLIKIINRGLLSLNKTRKLLYGLHLIDIEKAAIDYIAKLSSGDSRVALNILESINAYLSCSEYSFRESNTQSEDGIEIPKKMGIIKVTLDKLKPLLATRNYQKMYDKQGESHYDAISAFHKSVRGSDADAAIFYLVRMLEGGEDPLFIARRMIVIASEDIGLRDSSCLPFAIAAKEAVEFIGMPEGEIVLAHCANKLARAPKSTKSYRSLRSAQRFFSENPDAASIPIPLHLRNAPTKLMKSMGYGDTYRYNPNFMHGKVKQAYLPEELSDAKFVEDTHLGTLKDELVPDNEYDLLDKEKKDYDDFKARYKEVKLKHKALTSARNKRSPEDEELLTSEDKLSYDEFLSKVEQPHFFDGEEKDQYSDDPDCTHNFDCSYDEFFEETNQAELYYPKENSEVYTPKYPVPEVQNSNSPPQQAARDIASAKKL